jgi:predicted nucleic acid-binding protein
VTLVDTSIWVNHLRRGDDELRALLDAGEVLCHPLIIGELACGSIARRIEVLELLKALPQSAIAEHDEALHFLNERRLYGRGLGWIDLNLLASASLSRVRLWTIDRPLRRVAEEVGSAREEK